MKQFTWKKSYSVGVPILDTQHKQIFDIINQIEKDQQYSRISKMKDYLEQLFNYINDHFETEEAYMKAAKVPQDEFESHKAEHEQERAFFSSLLEKYLTNPDLGLPSDLLDELKSWVISHVLGTDHEYIDYMKNLNKDEIII